MDRVDTQHLHRVDLFADGAGPQVGADGRRGGSRDHQHASRSVQLRHRAERGAAPGDVRGAELHQQDVQREDDQDGVPGWRWRSSGRRSPGTEPARKDEFLPLERPGDRLGGQHTHLKEAPTAVRGMTFCRAACCRTPLPRSRNPHDDVTTTVIAAQRQTVWHVPPCPDPL